jgi:predicted N-formylglutamate amidohydrolase
MNHAVHDHHRPLLAEDEPPAFEIVNRRAPSPILFVCDHASNRVPRALDRLGLAPAPLKDHIAWDIGAAEVARRLARRFEATLILTGYSRLVIDCNRQLGDASSIASESDGIPVPGNRGLAEGERLRRARALFHPYHAAIRELIAEKAAHGSGPAIVSIHSFTPVFQSFRRPWQIGILWNADGRLARPIMAALARDPHLVIGDNEPYSARGEVGYTIIEHAEKSGRLHLMIEIRQDLIATADGVARWGDIVGVALAEAAAAAGLAPLPVGS